MNHALTHIYFNIHSWHLRCKLVYLETTSRSFHLWPVLLLWMHKEWILMEHFFKPHCLSNISSNSNIYRPTRWFIFSEVYFHQIGSGLSHFCKPIRLSRSGDVKRIRTGSGEQNELDRARTGELELFPEAKMASSLLRRASSQLARLPPLLLPSSLGAPFSLGPSMAPSVPRFAFGASMDLMAVPKKKV